MKYKIARMSFNYLSGSSLMRLFGKGRTRIPLEYMFYFNDNDFWCITRVNKGGTIRVVGFEYNITKFSYFDKNFPIAILMSDII